MKKVSSAYISCLRVTFLTSRIKSCPLDPCCSNPVGRVCTWSYFRLTLSWLVLVLVHLDSTEIWEWFQKSTAPPWQWIFTNEYVPTLSWDHSFMFIVQLMINCYQRYGIRYRNISQTQFWLLQIVYITTNKYFTISTPNVSYPRLVYRKTTVWQTGLPPRPQLVLSHISHYKSIVVFYISRYKRIAVFLCF